MSAKQVRESACDVLVVRNTGAQSAAQASHPCWFLYLHIVAPTDSHASFSTAHALHPPVHSDSVFATILWSSLSPLALSWLAGQSGLSRSISYSSQAYDAHTTSTVSSLGQTVELDGLHYFVVSFFTFIFLVSCSPLFGTCEPVKGDLPKVLPADFLPF